MELSVIEKQAMELPEIDRALLAERLWQSVRPVSDDIKQAWIEEAESRVAAFRRGEIKLIDGGEVMKDLRASYAH